MNKHNNIPKQEVAKISDLQLFDIVEPANNYPAWYHITFSLLILFVPVFVLGQTSSQDDLWPATTVTTKPWTRWWWMGSAVDSSNLKNLLTEYHTKGLGGVEIAPIYGARGFENRYLSYLSPGWREMLRYTVHIADSLGMGVDLTQGTGWPFGGPWVSREEAASRLLTMSYELHPGEELKDPLVPEDSRQKDAILQAVLGRTGEEDWTDLTHFVDENNRLQWNAGNQEWEVIAYFNGKTGQRVKRAAPGGAGYVLDHFSEPAVDDYLGVYDSAFTEGIPDFRAVYNDSYEVYGANWTESFLDEFQKRRGYELLPHLADLFSNRHSDTIRRLKSDYRETLHDLLLENFTRNWTKWAHQKEKITKNQAHGSPGNLLDLYGAVDIPECETFGSTYFPIPGLRRDSTDIRNVDPDPVMLKFASSAAHVTGKNLVSCETFTWLGEHFKSSFSQMKPELEQAFLAGVNHMFYHGVTYSPEDAPWPGWLFYASLNLTPANSLWPHFNDFNRYVTRCQSMLQNGWIDNEILVYWPVYDVWADSGALLNMLTVHHIDEWLHPTSFYQWSTKLMDRGYLLDFISDLQIKNSEASVHGIITTKDQVAYKTLIIPSCRYLPVRTLSHILEMADDGAKVIFEEIPVHVPGLQNHENRRDQLLEMWGRLEFRTVNTSHSGDLSNLRVAQWGKGEIILTGDIIQGLNYQRIKREQLADTGLGFIRRKSEGSTDYFLVNNTANPIDTMVPFNASGPSIVLLDPLSGDVARAQSQDDKGVIRVKLQLQPGQSIFVRFTDQPIPTLEEWNYRSGPVSIVELTRPWKLTFSGGGPDLPSPVTLENLRSWPDLEDAFAEYFSGQAVYETTFDVKDIGNYMLSLGDVRESCHIWINGQEVGYAWSIPYELDVSEFVQKGENSLRIEVANLMANRIRYMDQQGISWRNYHEINFVNIDYEPFDASVWEPVPSGLLGPVRLIKF